MKFCLIKILTNPVGFGVQRSKIQPYKDLAKVFVRQSIRHQYAQIVQVWAVFCQFIWH